METIDNPNGVQTVLCSLRELPLMKEKEFCKALYFLTEGEVLPDSAYADALWQVNYGKGYTITDENDPVNKIRSWIDCLRFLNRYLSGEVLSRIGDVNICFEYRLKNRWIDAIIVCGDKIIILEFKSGANINEANLLKYISQVNKYYNRISHRNRGIVEAIAAGNISVEKYLIFTNNAVIGHVEREDYILTAKTFARVFESITYSCTRRKLEDYLDTKAYFDPTITGAFLSLLTTGIVNYVEANNQNVQACQKIIDNIVGRNDRELGIILVKGGPGTGKTGTAFTLLQNCIKANHDAPDDHDHISIQYVTGNNNLEKYFSGMVEEAVKKKELYKDLEGIAESLIGHINTLYDPKNFCDVFLRQNKNVSLIQVEEDVLLIDEAQRLWNAVNIAVRSKFDVEKNKQTKEKKWKNVYTDDEQEYIYSNDLSETFLLLYGVICGIYWQKKNKCVVLFLGNGQEINNGEEDGENGVLNAIGRISTIAASWGIKMKVYVPEQSDVQIMCQYPVQVELDPELMLHNNQRNDEGDPQLNVVTSILENTNAISGSQSLYRVYNNFSVIKEAITSTDDDEDYSIGLLVDSYDTWRDGKNTVYEFTDSGNSYSFMGVGLELYSFFHQLECNELQKFATQFDSQGLELDNTVVIWGDTLKWEGDQWIVNNDKIDGKSRYGGIWFHCDKVNKLIDRVPNPASGKRAKRLNYNDVKEQFVKNAYRVLLTRARQSTYLYVQDDSTYNHLRKLLNPNT